MGLRELAAERARLDLTLRHRLYMSGSARALRRSPSAPLEQVVERDPQDLGSALARMLGEDEVAADEEREGEDAAGLGVVLVGADRAEQRPHVLHALIVNPLQPGRDIAVASRPVAQRQ